MNLPDVAPTNLEDYTKYRLQDLYTESQSRPSYQFQDNCREGDSYSHDMLNGKHPDNVLADNFFSKRNIQIIQNGIRAGVHKKTQQTISEQDETQILLIMRYMYFQYAKHLPTCIAEQIQDLNKRT
ncbi:MAG: Phaeocystis globosa virus, partial [Cyanobacteriota bacterium]